jgi:putative serine/threonine protein kinase
LEIKVIPIERLRESPYDKIICYPNPTSSETYSRIKELKSLEVEAFIIKGNIKVFGIPILGKGHVGIVVATQQKSHEYALKIRRVDANRNSMRKEVEMLKRVNQIKVGPKLHNYTKNFILMELIEGRNIRTWLEQATKKEINRNLKDLMERCRRLDKTGIDHGELSKAHKHLIVTPSGKIRIIDFESASNSRRVSNLTSVIHYLFFQKENSQIIKKVHSEINLKFLISKLRRYKKEPNEENFKEILSSINL